jgi:hypothetical protein
MIVLSELADRLLRELAARLEAEGLTVRKFDEHQEVAEIQVRNPHNLGPVHELMKKMLTPGKSNIN